MAHLIVVVGWILDKLEASRPSQHLYHQGSQFRDAVLHQNQQALFVTTSASCSVVPINGGISDSSNCQREHCILGEEGRYAARNESRELAHGLCCLLRRFLLFWECF